MMIIFRGISGGNANDFIHSIATERPCCRHGMAKVAI
jgi:hypothetical protein